MEDALLVQRLKSGDKEAFDAIYEKYGNMALRMAYLVAGNMADSEDIVQETFVKCYVHIKELKDPDRFKSWFLQILYRTAYRSQKKKNREIPFEDSISLLLESSSPDCPDALSVSLQKEDSRSIRKALSCLSMKHRTVIILHYYNELSVEEIAEVMKCSPGTVKSRLFNARNKLKQFLSEDISEDMQMHREQKGVKGYGSKCKC